MKKGVVIVIFESIKMLLCIVYIEEVLEFVNVLKFGSCIYLVIRIMFFVLCMSWLCKFLEFLMGSKIFIKYLFCIIYLFNICRIVKFVSNIVRL